MARELLTLSTVRNTKPGDNDIRLDDGGGLYLLIKPNGAKWWRFDYSMEGNRKTLSFSVYPATGLADARRKAENARNLLIRGIDPRITLKEIKAEQRQAVVNKKPLDADLRTQHWFSAEQRTTKTRKP